MALRRPQGIGLLLLYCRPDGRRARPEARRGSRPRSFATRKGRYLVSRLGPTRSGLVRGGRRSRQAVSLGDSAGDACAQMVGRVVRIALLVNVLFVRL